MKNPSEWSMERIFGAAIRSVQERRSVPLSPEEILNLASIHGVSLSPADLRMLVNGPWPVEARAA